MDIRDSGGVRVGADRPVIVRSDDVAVAEPGRPVVTGPTAPGRGRRPVRLAVLGAVALLAVVAAVVWGTGRDQGGVSTTPAAPAAKPAGPAPLTVQVDVPKPVVAGQRATVVVRYTDGDGIVSGATEEWGDGVGAGSLKQGRCLPAGTGQQGQPARPAQPATGSFRASHVWAQPGSYPVKVSVTTFTCVDGAAVQEEAARTLTVEVAAR